MKFKREKIETLTLVEQAYPVDSAEVGPDGMALIVIEQDGEFRSNDPEHFRAIEAAAKALADFLIERQNRNMVTERGEEP